MTPTATTEPTKVLRVTEVARLLGIGLTTLYRWRAAGTFPAPRQLGERRVGYTRDQIDNWIESRPVVGDGE